MSRYEPLLQHLSGQGGREHPMSFAEIERVIGGDLPPSARSHRPWWSNNEGSHVAVRAWRRAGWKAARVDMAAERVVFLREPTPSGIAASPAEPDIVTFRLSELPLAVRAVVERRAQRLGGDRVAATSEMLREAMIAERQSIIRELAGRSKPGRDSVDLIREDRDGR